MTQSAILPGAEPFFFEGSEVGCLVSQGFTGSPQSVRPLGEYLAREGGFTVSGPRLTGHGTRPEELARAQAEDWIRDLERASEALAQRCSRVFVMGLSMGGTLALYLAGKYPERFAGVVPINAALFSGSPDMAGLVFDAGAPETVPGIGSDIKAPGATELAYPVVPVVALRQVFVLMAVARELLPRVVCPTLVFQSREDHVVPPENGPLILDGVGAKDRRLVWLEDSYHVATLDHDAQRIGEETLRFVRERL